MANPEQIEQELKQFLLEEDTIRKEDRIHALMSIFNKHFGLDKIDHIASKNVLDDCIGEAKRVYSNTGLPMRISKKEVNGQDVAYILVLEAFVSYLNRHKLLKKIVRFDHDHRR